ncbi:putative oxidoreductase ORF5 in fasciation locus [Actinomadura sp. RB99]|uniref:FAD-binding protein n=1 Tax=Actinomadura sp. RB99 TaxID=2691577 RepID=UPI0016899FDC|nr:FAD-binding protein [Actinomadura sp. RB99]MBD2895361.1 putative oxidoreductase ORF5 in fasciation locus [Actinomadura sp. RB99]
MRDFGGIVERAPARVVRPTGADEVVEALREARARRLEAVPRGCGHSTFGQSLTGGICLDMRGLAGVEDVAAGRAVAGAGTTWREVLAATLPHGLAPPVLTDFLDVTVGGTLSAGGVGGASHRYGTQADHVLGLDVVTGGGTVPCSPVACSPRVRPDLFDRVRGGLGRHGVITSAALRLVPAPERVLTCTIPCRDAAGLLRVQGEVAADDIAGQAKPSPDGWRYEVKATLYGDGPVPPGTTETEELPFLAFADRMRPDVEELVALGEWARPHPWVMVFLPRDRAADVIEATLKEMAPHDLGLSGVVLIKALRVGHVPMLAAPPEPVLFSVLKTASPGCAPVPEMLAANRALLDRARAAGGTGYRIGAVPDRFRPGR